MTAMKGILDLLHGKEATEELQVPLATFRRSREDSQRTRLLKEALKDAVNLYEKTKDDLPQAKGLKKAGQQVMTLNRMNSLHRAGSKLRVASPLQQSSSGLDALHCNDPITEMHGDFEDAREFSPAVKDCGKRIDHLCDRLRAIRPATPPDRAREKAKDDVRVLAKPPAQAVDFVKSRVDHLAINYITENVVFDDLEDLCDNLEKVEDYKGMRKLFPERFFHHHNLQLLSDYKMEKQPEEFRRCIWAAKPTDRKASKSALASRRDMFQLGSVPARRHTAAGSPRAPQPVLRRGSTRGSPRSRRPSSVSSPAVHRLKSSPT